MEIKQFSPGGYKHMSNNEWNAILESENPGLFDIG